MKQYSVVEAAKILGVSEETVRRWIRDGRLEAKRGLGRNGNALDLNAIVKCANESTRMYIDNVMEYLDKAGIAYKKVMANTTGSVAKAGANAAKVAAGVGAVGAGVGAAMMVPGVAAGVLPIVSAAMVNEYRKKTNYWIELDDAEPIGGAENHCESNSTVEVDSSELIISNGESQSDSLSAVDSEGDLAAKIIEERMKLIKLKQELAQITAQITICENQIEYFTLLQERK